MTRSRRKTPKVGVTTARSEKDDKRVMNSRMRRRTKVFMTQLIEHIENTPFPIPDEVMNKWTMAKDGKVYVRKGSSYYNQALRK